MVKIVELQRIPFYGGTTKQYKDVCFNKSGALEDNKVLKALDKEYYILIVYVFFNQDYLAFLMCVIKMRVKVAKVGLILSFGWYF